MKSYIFLARGRVLEIAKEYRENLLHQWSLFKEGKRIKIITVRKKK